MFNDIIGTYHKQSGQVLFVSLAMLLLMTIIGVTGMNASVLEERMAGNTYDRQLAMQAAEAALRAGEDLVRSYSCKSNVLMQDCSNGWCTYPDTQTVSNWATDPHSTVWSNAKTYQIDVAHTGARPRFIIEDLCERDATGSPPGTRDARIFRITALGIGGSSNAKVILQSTFEVPNPYPTGGNTGASGGDCFGAQYLSAVTNAC